MFSIVHRKPPSRGLTGRRRFVPARAGIRWPFLTGMRGVGGGFDFAATANARVRACGIAELLQGRRVSLAAPALVKRFAVPIESEPPEIRDGLFDVTRFHARRIKVVHSQAHSSTCCARGQPRDEKGACVAKMQPAAGSWSEATGDHVGDFPLCRQRRQAIFRTTPRPSDGCNKTLHV
jgi:hypothetical protein